MTTIPDDIQKTARDLCATVLINSKLESGARLVAKVLMAERERCAKIADEAWRLDYKAEWIAAAIRKGAP